MRQMNHRNSTDISSKGWSLDKAEKFVKEMEQKFGFTNVNYTRSAGKMQFINIAIQIKVDDNGKEVDPYQPIPQGP